MLPILSGAAVTESEAKRMIRAALPQMGDSVETLREKARRRQQMLNGAARGINAPTPFPESAAQRMGRQPSAPPYNSGSNTRQRGPLPRSNPPARGQRSAQGGRQKSVSEMTDAELRALIARGE